MNAPPNLVRFARCKRGAAAAEFALIVPLLLLFLIGVIDGGRFLYEVNQGEKATQIGARMAVVTNPVASGLTNDADFTSGLTQGDRIPLGRLGLVSCTNGQACTCPATPCPSSLARNGTAFDTLLARMQQIMPSITATNLVVEYADSGLGYAGNPSGMDISPLVTVRLTGMQFAPTLLFGGAINLPDFSYTLTMEDGQGTGSN